jgi:regulation of enolase protein 1 (concanavalin A-like superfamily)
MPAFSRHESIMKPIFFSLLLLGVSAAMPSRLEAQSSPVWMNRAIGSVGVAGSYSAGSAAGSLNLKGAGLNIWGTGDCFQMLSQDVAGNEVQITARVASIQNTSAYAMGGLMVRQGNATNSPNAAILVTPGSGLYFQNRLSAGGTTTRPTKWAGTAPKWLRLIYSGGYAVGYFSDDGAAWSRFSATRMTLTPPYLAGLAVTSYTTTQTCETDFENVEITGTPSANFGGFPNAWTAENLGSTVTGGQGAYDVTSGTILLTGAGAGVGGTANSGAYLHRTWYGNGIFVVRVEDGSFLSTPGKAGLTVSETTAAGSVGVNLYLTASNQAVLTTRTVAGGTTTTIATASAVSVPYFLKVERMDNRFSASISADGTTWKLLGTPVVMMGSKVEVGMAAASGNATVASTAVFDQLSLTGFDGNANELMDAWEIAMFGNLNQSAAADPDGDGLTNAQEQALGTNPHAANDPSALSAVPGMAVGIAPVSKPGGSERSVWFNVPGTSVGDLTHSAAFARTPDIRDFVAGASAPINIGQYFGQRLRGTLTAPVTGDYTFWVAADDSAELWLGTGESRFSKKRVAWLGTWAAFQNWDSSPTQKSVTVALQAGQKYWIEALGKECTGGTTWRWPGSIRGNRGSRSQGITSHHRQRIRTTSTTTACRTCGRRRTTTWLAASPGIRTTTGSPILKSMSSAQTRMFPAAFRAV